MYGYVIDSDSEDNPMVEMIENAKKYAKENGMTFDVKDFEGSIDWLLGESEDPRNSKAALHMVKLADMLQEIIDVSDFYYI